MSFVHVIIAKDDHLYMVSMHYRTAKKLIEKGEVGFLPLLKSRFLDAGYIVVDLNRKVIINGQHAFSVKTSDFSVVEA